MAIRLEERYKGLRSPHKLKSAVSGCTRECAEAQSKDFGIIATENGWNLYVCGNGGIKPRHGDLFATDLDDATLIKYIDRFLMFYIRTADRLQRTSTWMDNLDGGIDYLREVVIEDKLSLAAELEAQMAHIVQTYVCEWKATLEDPKKLQRFRQFVNSDEPDSGVVFVQERQQIRPARPEERLHLVAGSGVCALVAGEQVALFYLPAEEPPLYAVANRDPIGAANVLSRGVVGDIAGQLVVASPLFKQHYDLQTGACLEDADEKVEVYNVRLDGDSVLIAS